MAKSAGSKVDAALERALADELKEITRKEAGEDGKEKFVYSLLDRSRVYDRALKLQSIKAKLPDSDWGSEYKDKAK